MKGKSKYLVIGLLSLAVSLSAAIAVTAADTAKQGKMTSEHKDVIGFPLTVEFKKPEELKNSNFKNIVFSHVQHQQVACASCHHTWSGEAEVQGCATEGCHDNYTGKVGSMSYFQAFHSRNAEYSCYGCHLRVNKELAQKGQKPLKISPCDNNICHKRDIAAK